MITDIALLVLAALIFNFMFSKLQMPGLLGMVATGIILGPSVFNLINPEVIDLLKEFKTAALIVILIRAGLGIHKTTLQKVGKPALRMSLIPGIIEGTTVMALAHFILGFTYIEGGILGFIIAAVSPAVVVPQMLELKSKGFGEKKGVPTLILAGASLDDVFAITIFGVFVGLAGGKAINYTKLLIAVPAGIILGIILGAGIGFALIWYFKKFHLRDTKKVILFMIVALCFYEFTEWETIKKHLPVASLLGIMAMGFIILEKYAKLAARLALKFNKVWVLAEILLFVYIGTAVKIEAINSSMIFSALLILLLGLSARSIGVWISLVKSGLNNKEKLFCTVAYLPKATVQAAIGAVPLSMFYEGKMGNMTEATGQSILALAVISIIVTAPLGAIGIKLTGTRFLER